MPVFQADAPGRSAMFQDLTDGRPQYGIRLPAGEPDGDASGEGTSGQDAATDRSGPPAGGSTSTDASR